MKFLFLFLSCCCALSGSSRGTRVRAGTRPPPARPLGGCLGGERPEAVTGPDTEALVRRYGGGQTDRQQWNPGEGSS